MVKRFTPLDEYIDRQSLITVFRGFHDKMVGIALKHSRDWLLLQEIVDFVVDGYEIIHKSDVTRVLYDENCQYLERLYRSEKVMQDVGLPFDINLHSIHSALSDLQEKNVIVVIECEYPDMARFVAGKIVELDENEVTVQGYDTLGKWNPEPDVIELEEITRVQFGDRYTTATAKYLR